jgi:hypothetical protein
MEGEANRWLVIRVREAKLLVKWHFETDPDALIRLAYHAVPGDLVFAGLQQLFEVRVISNWAGYHDWLIATHQLYSHLPSSPTHHVMKPVCVSFVRGLHSRTVAYLSIGHIFADECSTPGTCPAQPSGQLDRG